MKAFEKLDDNTVVLNAVDVIKDSYVKFLLKGVLVEGMLVDQFINPSNELLLQIKYKDDIFDVKPEDAFMSTGLYEEGHSLTDKSMVFMPNDGEVFDYINPSIKIKKFTWNEEENKPVEKEVGYNFFNVYNKHYNPILFYVDGEYFSWDECVKWNDYKLNDGDNEILVKSAHKHTLLTESQKELVEEFRSLISRMNSEDIGIVINAIDENFEFYNTKEYCVYSEYEDVNEDYQIPINHGDYTVKISSSFCSLADACSTLVAEEKK